MKKMTTPESIFYACFEEDAVTVVFNVKESSKNKECSICQEDLPNGNHVKLTRCEHAFHEECLSSWFVTKVEAEK